MQKLSDLLKQAGYTSQNPELDGSIVQRLTTDSRDCRAGDLFIGMPGTQVDGSKFAAQALANGAIAAVVSAQAELPTDTTGLILVEDVVVACAKLAEAFYGYPAQTMKLVGVTGTNGKTTTTHLVEFLLSAQFPTALFGTLYARWQGHVKVSAHTTPFAIDLQSLLKQAADGGCQVAVMEISSHALAQKRALGCPFEVAVFTNLTQDHLDYHRDLEDYFATKALLFQADYLKGRAIINLDDTFGERLVGMVQSSPVWTYSLTNPQADFYTENLTYGANGVTGTLHTPLGAIALKSSLVGSFNVANIIAAIATAVHLGVSLEAIALQLPEFQSVPGRVERVQVSDRQDVTVVVDYAHTPDSLENLLKAMRPFTQRELICMFGCGGDRDRTKRPLMGGIAARLADRVYVTSDNPRTEDPQRILADIMVGVHAAIAEKSDANAVTIEGDRRKCIQMAIAQAQSGDTILLAGKGHEDYQILGKEKIHFDDREEAQAALQVRLSSQ
ncbi:UDP-N-acetylmuramoyl-L-alanyl-D-glutamate--2,6-diaminopimelate ligase [Tumidithrix elongata RA019]|uniref:UDP-N-acetylmuramoyl-L-alanyl-D-glutamate--2,6-diaminopimelate ligase n=1 Tax=Tumidithrix elongata BACA0141 TaxID=2716417 RepID=A0AAW9PU05_9CYAN|nr:UDP-N-acetylmuramoyl-L-alanyl-D-glutamate--2,6-diaminopimelate ligase [Tumidithrix elongata RA019]